MLTEFATPARNTCAYCGTPCPNRHCSWECARFDRQNEDTWRRTVAASEAAAVAR